MFHGLQHLPAPLSDHVVLGTTADLMHIERNSPDDLRSLVVAACTSLLVVCGCLGLLKLLHMHLPEVFGQRACSQRALNEDLTAVGSGLLGWAAAVRGLQPAQVMSRSGLDALMLGEFHGLCRELFGVLGLAGMTVLAPVHFLASRAGTAEYLGSLDVGAVVGLREQRAGAPSWELQLPSLGRAALLPCWLHAAAAWFVVLVSLHFIFKAQHRFLEHRFRWLEGMRPPRSTTLMVEGIPAELRSDGRLKEYYARLFSSEAVARAYVVRRTEELRRLTCQVESLERRLVVALAQGEDEGGGSSSSALPRLARWCLLPSEGEEPQALERQLGEARAEAEEERARVERAARELDLEVCSQSGFVTFSTQRWCRLASREQLRADAGALRMSAPPDPEDVLFADLAQDSRRSTSLEWLARLLKFCVVCTWMPIVLTVTAVADLATLRRRARFVDELCLRWPSLAVALEGVLATLLLQGLMSLLPRVILLIITKCQTLKSGAWAQLELQKTFYWMQVVFVLLVTAINQTVLASLRTLLNRPGQIFGLLADHLPDCSHFYLNYVAIGCMGLAVGCLRLGALLEYAGRRLMGLEPQKARELAEVLSAKAVDNGTGTRMSRASFMATVALVFSTSAPLIMPIAWVYFYIGEHTFRYLVVYGENRQPDLGGAFWLTAVQSLIAALVLFVMLMVGILSRAGDPIAAGVAAGAMSALLVGWSRLNRLRGDSLPFESVVDVEHKLKPGEPAQTEQTFYQQPECSPHSGPC